VCRRITGNEIGEAIYLEDSDLQCESAEFNGKRESSDYIFWEGNAENIDYDR
jgi:hypothetical protein